MCGICGLIDPSARCGKKELESIVHAMTSQLEHRGPDDSGIWSDERYGVSLGHRRLSVIDLSSTGRQPMVSPDGRYAAVYNGEIYNYVNIRTQLETEGVDFRGSSDTEVALAAFERWGIEGAIERFNGMFAFGIWDLKAQTLELVRDRFGQKPLYFGFAGKAFLFASEMKALMAHPDFERKIDRDSLNLLLRRGCIPAPYSVFKGVNKVKPGHRMTVRLEDIAQRSLPEQTSYWSPANIAVKGPAGRFSGSYSDAAVVLDALINDAVSSTLVSDVEVGALLSGGVDSSLVVALMQQNSSARIKTFSVGFREKDFNEAPHAARVAQHLGTDHAELYVTEDEAVNVIPELPYIYDEPFADPSQIPTTILCRLISRSVKVALTGDGGDELFGGYNHYRLVGPLTAMTTLPRFPKTLMTKSLVLMTPFSSKARGLQKFLEECRTPAQVLVRLRSIWKDPESVVLLSKEPLSVLTDASGWPDLDSTVRLAMAVDVMSYMTDDVLVKVDRAAMASSLETRIPLLDHRIMAAISEFPTNFFFSARGGKRILRTVLSRYLPPDLLPARKHGFSVPLDRWLRSQLRDWMENLLSKQRIEKSGFFHYEKVSRAKEDFLRGRTSSLYLWPILMFEAWRDAWQG